MNTQKKYYITTSIPYVNAALHVGHAFEYAEADALARYHRLLGDRTFLLTGADEHGKKIYEAAERAQQTPRQFVDAMYPRVKSVLDGLGISYDGFIRTSDAQHTATAQSVWQTLKANGDIYKEQYRGKYCIGCEAFLRDAEMRDGVCIIHEKPVQDVYEENYFFRFSKYAKEVERLVREGEIRIMPEHRKREVLNLFSDEGIKDISVSRPADNVKWGVTVPNDPAQIMYVWVDALLNYLSGAGFEGERFAEQWPPDVQVIGKDIARFHIMLWLAMLLSLKLALPKSILIHGHIAIEGRKMSKSLGNVINPLDLVASYGKDAIRYFLLREIPSDDDGDFSFSRLSERYAADLQNGIGNLVSRTTGLAEKYPAVWKDLEIDEPCGKSKAPLVAAYHKAIERFQLHAALIEVWRLVDESNKLIDETKLWETMQSDPTRARGILKLLGENLWALGILLTPFIPDTAKKVLASIGVKDASFTPVAQTVLFTKPEHPLFPRIEK